MPRTGFAGPPPVIGRTADPGMALLVREGAVHPTGEGAGPSVRSHQGPGEAGGGAPATRGGPSPADDFGVREARDTIASAERREAGPVGRAVRAAASPSDITAEGVGAAADAEEGRGTSPSPRLSTPAAGAVTDAGRAARIQRAIAAAEALGTAGAEEEARRRRTGIPRLRQGGQPQRRAAGPEGEPSSTAIGAPHAGTTAPLPLARAHARAEPGLSAADSGHPIPTDARMLVSQPGAIGRRGDAPAAGRQWDAPAIPMPLATQRGATAWGDSGWADRMTDTTEAGPAMGEPPLGWTISRAARATSLPLVRYTTRDGGEPATGGRAPAGAGQAIGRVVSVDTEGASPEPQDRGERPEEIDYEKLADHVWRRVKRRIQVERERERGFA